MAPQHAMNAQQSGTVKAQLAELKRRWPGVEIWHGNATGRWWALLDELVDAETPRDLDEVIRARRSWIA